MRRSCLSSPLKKGTGHFWPVRFLTILKGPQRSCPLFQRAVSLVLVLATVSRAAAQSANPVVVIDTSLGAIKVELFADKAPLTVKNFLQYADDHFYDGTIFHRVHRDFFIQGGTHLPGLKEKKTRPPIKSEATDDMRNLRGTIGLARSATASFYFNVNDNVGLDQMQPRYTVFGKVIAGMDVVDKIRMVPVASKQPIDAVPVDDVIIRSIRLASQFTLVAAKTDLYAVGSVFTITAHIEHPVRGQTLSLELPTGLERIEGKEIQPVAALPDLNASFVSWRVRGTRPGDYEYAVRSNAGTVQKQKLRITAAAN